MKLNCFSNVFSTMTIGPFFDGWRTPAEKAEDEITLDHEEGLHDDCPHPDCTNCNDNEKRN